MLLVKAVLQPTKWRKGEGRGEEEKGWGGGEERVQQDALLGERGCRSHDPCDVAGILMSHKVPRQKISRNKVHRGVL